MQFADCASVPKQAKFDPNAERNLRECPQKVVGAREFAISAIRGILFKLFAWQAV